MNKHRRMVTFTDEYPTYLEVLDCHFQYLAYFSRKGLNMKIPFIYSYSFAFKADS